ncbi:MAG: hypothetical protein R3E12_06430 [Candidatus Eisenbacteria bacterium]|uniref:Uncharacterized protein n=1 Tax=Eiseniibacteriota bacterium TaxID=2212470 RepID=A0A956RQP3_UNCEI|nr:hypothetical protein [Candidatus Eisenbacteria bacterium]
MNPLRWPTRASGTWAALVALAATVGCAGHFGGPRSSNTDLTVISFGSLQGESTECG